MLAGIGSRTPYQDSGFKNDPRDAASAWLKGMLHKIRKFWKYNMSCGKEDTEPTERVFAGEEGRHGQDHHL